MTVVSMCAAKGGVGRTSTSLAVASEFARLGYQVILCDLDPQASATSALHVDVVGHTQSPLDLPPVPLPAIEFAAGRLLLARSGRRLEAAGEQQVRARLASLREQADIVVVDTMPTLGPSVRATLGMSDLVLAITEPTWLALRGASEMITAARVLAPQARLRGVLTRYRSRLILTREIDALLAWQYAELFYDIRIPLDVRVAEAPRHGLPVTLYQPLSRAALAYTALTRLIAQDVGDLRPVRADGVTTDAA